MFCRKKLSVTILQIKILLFGSLIFNISPLIYQYDIKNILDIMTYNNSAYSGNKRNVMRNTYITRQKDLR